MTIETFDPQAPLSFDHITLTDRPLIVCDIDEVVLEFVTPFQNFLRAGGRDLVPRSFRLHGNIVQKDNGEPVADATVATLIEDFFLKQDAWQTPAHQVAETLEDLSGAADIVFLTAMPPRHTEIRRRLLDQHGLSAYPLLATEAPKGPVVRQLHDARDVPVVFIDDILRNLESVREHAPDCLLIRLMANATFLAMAPAPDDGIETAADWHEAARIIRQHLLR
ncbi:MULTISPECIES: hypothetical protein [unclassified Rhizobium]|jgi:hypothetical protein|uniref:hypothetical protein n=1 Tax=unclassified Rhizobium TaxID=2613769 RepID=UPI00071417AD|nr:MULTISPECIES: hypothetical protein [unclassified Rhizobium]KQR73456.1 hypothetical protein ASG03_01260 [Rhizobium sp. Leaf341]KQS74127.1 hypothetical protein ASG58_16540 [Rhizobium sp. Leaf383]